MRSKSAQHQQSLELRKKGYSYSKIASELRVSKSTLSNWLSTLEWSNQIGQQINHHRKLLSATHVKLMNTVRLKKLDDQQQRFKDVARQQFDLLVQQPLFLIGLSLYWGEGTKRSRGKVGLINADPRVLQIIMRFYVEILKIPKEKIRAEIFAYPDHNLDDLQRFWSSTLLLEPRQFIKTRVLKSRATLTHRKLLHGVCNVYFSSTEFSIKIHEWIDILSEKISESSSVG